MGCYQCLPECELSFRNVGWGGAGYLPDGSAGLVTGGGLVELSLVSMYAFARGWFKQVMTGWRVNLGEVRARASGRMYPVAISTLCWKRSCSRTMKPVLSDEALPRMYSQFCKT